MKTFTSLRVVISLSYIKIYSLKNIKGRAILPANAPRWYDSQKAFGTKKLSDLPKKMREYIRQGKWNAKTPKHYSDKIAHYIIGALYHYDNVIPLMDSPLIG